MLTLAIDTAANFCSACVYDTAAGNALAVEERDIGRGHAEELIGVIAGVLRDSGAGFADIGCIAVSVGPGSFTGIRVGVAAARGLGLALGVPVAGVTTLEAIAADALAEHPGEPLTVAIRGGRGQVFIQSFDTGGAAASQPEAVDEQEAESRIPAESRVIAGNAAAALAARSGLVLTACVDRATGSIATVARLAEGQSGDPVPLYLRGADAKPQAGFALSRAETLSKGAGA